ncbi:MAG: M24 family metallopeptidase [Gemmatimonadetes bacterium]|nr:M24 family metallopeptidase [Gemmatimonadota bacterium]
MAHTRRSNERDTPTRGIRSAALFLSILTACASGDGSAKDPVNPLARRRADGSMEVFGGRVIPALPRLLGVRQQYELRFKWLEDKHRQLLPMMRKHGIAMWIVTNHEFHPDPVTAYVAPDQSYTDAFLVHVFVDAGNEGLKRFSSWRRPKLDYARLFEPLPVPRDERGQQDAAAGLRILYQRYQPRTIGLDFRSERGQESGLTHDDYERLVRLLGPDGEKRFVPARDLIEDYFDTRLPDELEYYRALVLATDIIAQRALSNEVITPGVTKAADVKWFFDEQIASLGVGGKPWFEIHTAVQRFDAATGKAIPYAHPAPDTLTFQRGDVIHLDCGFDYLGFASDWQKVAYILRDGETDASAGMKLALANANRIHQLFRSEPRAGMTGWEAAGAIVRKLAGAPFVPSLYSHPIGYQGHALGSSIDARNGVPGPRPARESRLRPGNWRSVEFSAKTALPEWNGDSLLIPMEDDAFLTDHGYEYFRPYQTSWYLIR